MLKAKRDMVKIFEDPWENMQCQTHVDFVFHMFIAFVEYMGIL